MEELLFADRSERAKLSFTGPQDRWFLHQITTQAFEDMAPGEARDAAMITAHGRMLGYMEVVATDQGLLAHYEAPERETFRAHIERYVFATQVEISDVTDEYDLVLLAGEGYEAAVSGAAPEAVVHPTRSLGIPAAYLWLPAGEGKRVREDLAAAGYVETSEEQLEAMRIRAGIPRWGRDMGPKTLPPEANLDDVAVHYNKGCYLGQEAMAKIRFRGRVNRRLRRLQLTGAAAPGDEVTLDGAVVGTVTSAASDRALAMLKRDVPRGAEVQVAGRAATVLD